jgi:hypothetical protein
MGISLGLVENPHAKTAVTFDPVPEGTGAAQHRVAKIDLFVHKRSSRQQIPNDSPRIVIPA